MHGLRRVMGGALPPRLAVADPGPGSRARATPVFEISRVRGRGGYPMTYMAAHSGPPPHGIRNLENVRICLPPNLSNMGFLFFIMFVFLFRGSLPPNLLICEFLINEIDRSPCP